MPEQGEAAREGAGKALDQRGIRDAAAVQRANAGHIEYTGAGGHRVRGESAVHIDDQLGADVFVQGGAQEIPNALAVNAIEISSVWNKHRRGMARLA
ncbi:hypothetical protein D5S18_21060 [Nocardia panacis]|uniref:Uncharacterized protein n=1 Tax=Nocardia panacis TaxID=2340916 RepID=A0A3A4KL07_9NOCA|nr:hypothetical protein [Nocardia panacis]RJO73667.1 hypothetical protein D5S18_21060 [Nocardia panacis]